MKYYSRLKLYKASNVTFNPETLEAYSYGWWKFVAVIGGKVVFNNYSYSNSTIKHQYKVKRVLDFIGIPIDISIQAPKGLQDLDSAYAYHLNCATLLEADIAKKGTRKAKNEERRLEIRGHETKMRLISQLQTKMPKAIDNDAAFAIG